MKTRTGTRLRTVLKWIHLYRCWQLTTTIWSNLLGKVIVPVAFFSFIVFSTIFNFLTLRDSDLAIGMRLAMMALSTTVMGLSVFVLQAKAKEYQLSLFAVESRRRACNSKFYKQLLLSCRPNASMIGTFSKIDNTLVMLFPYSVLNYTMTLLITFKN